MELAKIDWKTVESLFTVDSLYEHINAPKWVDLSAPPDPNDSNQDESWFCRPDCKHPKTAEDFYKLSPPAKLLSTVGVSDILVLRDRNKRDVNLKRRQAVVNGRPDENCENNDPYLSTPPPNSHSKSVKEAFKSSADNKMPKVVLEPLEQTPKLKSTRSAKNLLGRDIFSHITEFCNELKKLAIRAKDKENEGVESSLISNTDNSSKNHYDDDRMAVEEVVRTPLMGISKEKFGSGSNSREKIRRKKRNEEPENTPIVIDLNSLKSQESQKLLKIRTNPPTPQCFSAVHGQANGAPMNDISATKSKFMERNILQEMKQGSTPKGVELPEKSRISRNAPLAAVEREAKPLDMFWFLKPCTLSEPSN